MTRASEVGRTTYTTPSDREFRATRVVAAPRALVWDCWTKPEHLPNWLLGPEGWTMPVCEIDLRPGGSWRYVWRNADGEELDMHGVYREVVPPERLVNTETWGPEWPETVNTLVLTEDGGMTTMESTTLYPSQEARDQALATGMTEGMSASYARLDQYLGSLG